MRARLGNVRLPRTRCRFTSSRDALTVRRTVFGQLLLPVHLSVITVADGKPLATRMRLRVLPCTRVQDPRTEPVRGGNGSTRPSQFSSVRLPITSRAVG